MKRETGFTLIELLIVVAIIAILAAIAVPNFLEAQVRAKVARARSDMRTIACALEAYGVDNTDYPMMEMFEHYIRFPCFKPYIEYIHELTTPVAYMTTVALRAPLMKEGEFDIGTLKPVKIDKIARYISHPYRAFPLPTEWIGSYGYFRYNDQWAWDYFGKTYCAPGYGVFCPGPCGYWDNTPLYPFFKVTGLTTTPGGPPYEHRYHLDSPLDVIYDPTNGTKSRGGMARFGAIPGVGETL